MLAQKSPHPAAAEFFGAARTWLDTVGDRDRAGSAMDRALASVPVHPGALELKARLSMESQRYAEAAAALALRLQQGGEQQELAALNLKLGGIYQDHLSDATRSAAHLQTTLALNPGSAEALERLSAIHSLSRNWTGAADCLRRLLDLGGDPSTLSRHTLSLAQIFDEGLGDVQHAAELCRRALELAPGEDGTISRLVDLQERLGNLPELAELLEQQAGGSADARRSIALLLRAAELQAGPMGDVQKALSLYGRIVGLDPTNVTAHSALADLHMRDAASAGQAIDAHRTVVRLEPSSLESLHALFRLWAEQKQTDRAFCVAGVLQFLRTANEAESAFYGEFRNRLPHESRIQLETSELDLLMPEAVRGHPLVATLRAVGDQLSRIHPPHFESSGIDRKADRLKTDHAVYRAIQAVAELFGVDAFEVYQSRRGLMFLETTEPLAVCVGQDVVRKFNVREQKFLIGRAVLGLRNKTAVLQKLSKGEVADLIGNSIRIVDPDFETLGRQNDEASRQLRKAYSRKTLKALELPALEFAAIREVALVELLEGLSLAADRAGLLVCADVATGLNMLMRQDPNYSALRTDTPDPYLNALKERHDLRQLLDFALSEDFFNLRQKFGVAL
jgi:tetratricopeptide (TPR) repeat protein